MRIACVFVPQLALQAVLRRTPDARGGPVAVLEAGGDGAASAGGKARPKRIARVTEFSPEARREGVRAGMTGAQAAAVSAGLRLLTVTAADREAASAALADVGYAFAPRIERADAGDRVFFETEDLSRLYPAGEQAIAQGGAGGGGARGPRRARRHRRIEGGGAAGDAGARAGGGAVGRRAGARGAGVDSRRDAG
jgi:hypothetical protein